MFWDFLDSSVVLGIIAAILFAECIILFVNGLSYKSKMEAKLASVKEESAIKTQKRLDEIEITLRERSLALKSEYDELLNSARKLNEDAEERANKAELLRKDYESAKSRCIEERDRFSAKSKELSEKTKELSEKMLSLASLDKAEIEEEAKKILLADAEKNLSFYAENFFAKRAKEIEKRAIDVLLSTMQSIATKECAQSTTCIVQIPNEAMKGRLIGKDGRNIRSFEYSTATTLVIDETPDSVMISSFDPVKRETAKIALENLIADGRINPATIEEQVKKAKDAVSELALKKGKSAVAELGLSNVDTSLCELVGRLYFHLSLNQNSLQHSMECAVLAGAIAHELNLNSELAMRCALFHDIGKVMPQESLENAANHALAGANFLRACGECKEVVSAAASHHGDVDCSDEYSAIVRIADTISASRPGARMEASQAYFKRVKLLEQIAYSFDGVQDAYVIQAGREIRVILKPESVSENRAVDLAAKIRDKISESYDSLGPVKITIIRENRWTETSKQLNA